MLIRLLFIAALLATSMGILCAAEHNNNPKTQALGALAYKVDARLIPALTEFRAGTTTAALAAQSVKSAHGRALASTTAADTFAIRIDATVTAALLTQIKATGTTVIDTAPQWRTINATATIAQLDALAKIDEIQSITLQAGKRRHQQGVTANAADPLLNADKLRATFGVTGKGQTVGVVSDSVIDTNKVQGRNFTVTGTPPNAFVTGTTPQQTGDLPQKFQLVDPGPGQGSDEGEAMMELIYDIAPGAGLAFGSAGNSQTAAATNLLALRTAAKCTVTVDDIGFLDEPYFQDGPLAQAISTNTANGVPHFSATGNDGTSGILATYTPLNPSQMTDDMATIPTGKDFHNWGIATSTPGFLPIRLSHNDDLTIILQWNQPFSSFNLGAGSQADLDLYLYASPAIGKPLAMSTGPQGTVGAPAGDPVEILDYVNKGSDTVVYLALDHFQGVRGNVIRVLFTDTNLDFAFPSGGVNGMSAFGHPTTKDCIAVGAMNFADLQSNNLRPESFSSLGGYGANGIPFYFDAAGNPLPNAPVLRNSPDIAAPDGVDTNFFPNFLGTSCAAPNAAAVGALLLEAAPRTPPALLAATLRNTARDSAVAPATPGPDGFTGFGLVDAVAALRSLVPPPVITSPKTASGNVASFFSYTITATGQGPLTYTATPLPAGVTFSGATFSGIPTTVTTNLNVAITAVNVGGTGSQTVVVNIGPQVPVRVLSQVTATPNPAAIGAAVAFAVDAVSDLSLPLTYTWDFGDSANGTGATVSHSYANGGTYIATVVVSDGTSSVTANVTVVVTGTPVITSPATATPSIAGIGQTVQFVSAAVEGSATLTYTWDFGDSVGASGAAVAHSYAAAGTFTASVVVTDPNGNTAQSSVTVTIKAPLVGTGKDSDGDGFSDSFESAVGTDPLDPNSTPLGNKPATSLQPLTASKTSIKLNFTKSGADTIAFAGTLPIPAGFSANGQKVYVDVSAVTVAFTLDAKGGTPRGNNVFKLQFRSSKGSVSAQTGKFTVKLNKGFFTRPLAAVGLTSLPVSNTNVSVVLTVIFNGAIYQSTQSLTYNNKGGKMGTAK